MNAVETDLHPFAGHPAALNGPLDRGQIHSCRLGSGRLPITILCERILRGKMRSESRGTSRDPEPARSGAHSDRGAMVGPAMPGPVFSPLRLRVRESMFQTRPFSLKKLISGKGTSHASVRGRDDVAYHDRLCRG
jgi:hypothetical protein